MSGSGSSDRPPWEQTRRVPAPQSASRPWGQPAQPTYHAPAGPYQVASPQYQAPLPGYGDAQPYPMGYPGQAQGFPPGYGTQYTQPFGGATGWTKPHRAVALLVLAGCSFALCFVCGIIAFFLARTDLQEMRQGIMDPSGEQLTKVAYWVSLVHMCLLGFLFVFYFVLFVVFAATSP